MQQGFLDVGQGHQLYYTYGGNEQALPILFLHGGPGLACSTADWRFFDPARHRVIFLDQRGCGKSKAHQRLHANTTQHLIEDIVQLLDFLSIERVVLFGGSWGSTLALLFAISHPKRVEAMILRGIFTASRQQRQHFENGGTQSHFPEAWQRYVSHVPSEARKGATDYYFEHIASSDTKIRQKLAYELVYYGLSVSSRAISAAQIEAILHQMDYEAYARLLAHYSRHDFFIPDRYIEAHLPVIERIPTHIVHGRYDLVCLPIFAYHLFQQLKQATLTFTDAGHSPMETETTAALKRILKKFG